MIPKQTSIHRRVLARHVSRKDGNGAPLLQWFTPLAATHPEFQATWVVVDPEKFDVPAESLDDHEPIDNKAILEDLLIKIQKKGAFNLKTDDLILFASEGLGIIDASKKPKRELADLVTTKIKEAENES